MNAKDATKQLIDMGCKYLRITGVEGEIILYQNAAKDSSPAATKAQAEKICSYIGKAPAGTYVIQGRTSPQAKPTSITISKGEESPTKVGQLADSAPSRAIPDPDVLTYSAALKMQAELAELRAENKRLNDLVEALQADLDELEAQEPEQMAESPALNQLAQAAALLPGIVDQWFQNQKEKRELERQKLAAMMMQRQGAPVNNSAQAGPAPTQNDFDQYFT